MKYKLFFIFLIVLSLSFVVADWTPQSNINLRNVYNITGAPYVNATLYYGNGSQLTGLETTSSNYSAFSNSSTYWDGETSQADLNVNQSGWWSTYHIATDLNNLLTLNWANITNKFITAVDNSYIYMSSTTATLNETKLNETIELIDTATNTSMKLYVDGQDVEFNDSMKNYVDAVNITQGNWVDTYFPKFTELVGQVGNWTLDKVNYYTSTQTDTQIETTERNWTYLQNYPVACPAGSSITQLNDSVTCTSFGDASYQFEDNNFNGSGNITAKYYFGNGSQLTGITHDNSSWNESYADTLYYDINNPFGYYNSTNPSPVINNSYVPYTGATSNLALGDNNFSVGTSDLFVNEGTGNVGIGTTAPEAKLHIAGGIKTVGGSIETNRDILARYGYFGYNGYSNNGVVTIRDNNAFDYLLTLKDVNRNDLVVFETSGNVGIGTTSPVGKLHVNSSDNTPFVINATNGNVGIGTTAPTSALHVSKTFDGSAGVGDPQTILTLDYPWDFGVNVNLNTGAGSRLLFKIPYNTNISKVGASIDAVKYSFIDSNSATDLVFSTSQNDETLDEAMRIVNDGNVGIGTTSPASKLQVAGDIFLQNDTDKLYFGQAKDVSIEMNGSAFNILDEVGSIPLYLTGFLKYIFDGDVEIDGGLTAKNISLDKYGVSAYLNESAVTTITTAGTWYPINGTFVNYLIEGFYLNVTDSLDPSIVYNGTETQWFDIDWHATVSGNVATTIVGLSIQSYIPSNFTKMETLLKNANQKYNIGGTMSVELAHGERIQLSVTSDGDGDEITIYQYTTSIRESFA